MNTEMMNKATCSQRKHDNTFPSLSQKENDCKIKNIFYKLLGVVFNGILHSRTLFSQNRLLVSGCGSLVLEVDNNGRQYTRKQME